MARVGSSLRRSEKEAQSVEESVLRLGPLFEEKNRKPCEIRTAFNLRSCESEAARSLRSALFT